MTSTRHALKSPQAAAIQAAFDLQMGHYKTVGNSSARVRKAKLKALEHWMLEHKTDIRQALHNDFAKPGFETDFSDTYMALSEARHARRELHRWMRDEPVKTPLAMFGTKAWVRRESKGVCLIMAPWNFPWNLAVGPLVSAIAAGNCVILKPSERTPHTTDLLARMVSELFPPEEVTVIGGAVPESQDLLRLPFHHIFFTGSPQVGKIVMAAAAEHLSSVTLELGGKSPAIVDASANIKRAAQRITWGRFFNAGQTCVAPDYVLVEASVKDAFVKAMHETVAAYYGTDPASNPDYGNVVDEKHAATMQDFAPGVASKGSHVPPTLVVDADPSSPALQTEIFGPVLPIRSYTSPEEVLAFIEERDRPLAFYVFSKKGAFINQMLQHTRAGSTGINLTVGPFGHRELPFGGVNASGIGKAHGWWGFEAFTNLRSVHKSTLPVNYHFLVAPPYKGWRQKVLNIVMRWL
ncbi:MAG: aldehyde dehydrogenase family protein [Flavobacteriales bacterium]